MMKLCGFADEIAPELDEQIKCCKENGVTHFELRGVYGKNVLDFDKSVQDRSQDPNSNPMAWRSRRSARRSGR